MFLDFVISNFWGFNIFVIGLFNLLNVCIWFLTILQPWQIQVVSKLCFVIILLLGIFVNVHYGFNTTHVTHSF